jgi:hypothetical protein
VRQLGLSKDAILPCAPGRGELTLIIVIERMLIDNLKFKARGLAEFWKDLIRKNPHLKHYNELDDAALVDLNEDFYPVLAQALERGLDKNSIGAYFVRLGKDRMRMGFPVSEVLFSINLSQKVVVEYLMTECVMDNSMQMYQVVDVMTRISEFFLLGSFYMTKGFLEETYVALNSKEALSEDLLKRYFRDDFFFK